MTTGDGFDPRERACKNPDCGRRFVPAVVGWNRRPAEYCNEECRRSAQSKRQKARERAAREARAKIPCATCGQPFVPRNAMSRTCSAECHLRYKRKQEIEAHGDERERLDASKAQALPPAPRRCPECGAKAVRDEDARGFYYCENREECDWSVLLTAKTRDPRSDTPVPEPDPEEEPMREYDPDDQDEDEERDQEDEEEDEAPESVPPVEVPASKPAPAKAPSKSRKGYRLQTGRRVEAAKDNRAAVLAAIADGQGEPGQIAGRTRLCNGTLYRILNRLIVDGEIERCGTHNRATYRLVGATAQPAKKATKPAPIARSAPARRNASVTPTLDSLRAQVAALALPDLLTLLGDLSPLLGPLAALQEAQKGLRP